MLTKSDKYLTGRVLFLLLDKVKRVSLANGKNKNLYDNDTQTGQQQPVACKQTSPMFKSSHPQHCFLHRASDTTNRLARDQRERGERSDTHTRELPLFGENARDVGNGGLVGRCSIWCKPRLENRHSSWIGAQLRTY